MAELVKASFIRVHRLALLKAGFKGSALDGEKLRFLELGSREFPNGGFGGQISGGNHRGKT